MTGFSQAGGQVYSTVVEVEFNCGCDYLKFGRGRVSWAFTVTSCFRVLQLWRLCSSGISQLCCYSDTNAFCLATDNHLTITRNTWIKVKALFRSEIFCLFCRSWNNKLQLLKLSVFLTLHVCSWRRVHLELIVSLTRLPCPIHKIRFLSTRDKMKMVQ